MVGGTSRRCRRSSRSCCRAAGGGARDGPAVELLPSASKDVVPCAGRDDDVVDEDARPTGRVVAGVADRDLDSLPGVGRQVDRPRLVAVARAGGRVPGARWCPSARRCRRRVGLVVREERVQSPASSGRQPVPCAGVPVQRPAASSSRRPRRCAPRRRGSPSRARCRGSTWNDSSPRRPARRSSGSAACTTCSAAWEMAYCVTGVGAADGMNRSGSMASTVLDPARRVRRQIELADGRGGQVRGHRLRASQVQVVQPRRGRLLVQDAVRHRLEALPAR